MTMSNLFLLMESLKAFTVVIIENALQYETDPQVILGKFSLKKCNRSKILTDLKRLGHAQCADLLNKFYIGFQQSDRKPEIEAKGAETFFKRYISKDCGITNLNEDEVIVHLKELILTDVDDLIKSVFMRHGINSIEEADYSHIIDEINKVEKSNILFYKSNPSADETEAFFSNIDQTCDETGSEFCLAIIDKKLGTGGADEEGRNFIVNKIIPGNIDREKKIICCLYTSAPVELVPKKFEDYFLHEIGKTSQNKLDHISKTLAKSAYAQVFYLINVKQRESSKEALDLVLLNQQNIKYIIQESHLEGIPAYEAIKYWFNLAQQYIYEKKEKEKFDFNATLTSFFNQDYIEDHPHIAEIGDDLKALNAYEIFDFSVNHKFLPIAPGDIWKRGETYYILLGQLCDILLRQTENKRGAKVGEFLKVELVKYRDSGKKYDVEVKGTKVIWIENFYEADTNEYKTLKIEVSTSNIYYVDLRVLDLAMFNKNGICQIKEEGELEANIKQILPLNKDSYYKKLQSIYPPLLKIKEIPDIDLTAFLGPIDIPVHDFTVSEGLISHDIKRVARLKGRYFDSLYNNYNNNKSRIDLNLIDNAVETAKTIQLSYKLLSETDYKKIELRIWSKKEKEYIKKEDFQTALNGEYSELVSLYGDLLSTSNSTQYELTKLDDISYQLDMYVYLAFPKTPKFHNKSTINYPQLFGGKPANPLYSYLDNQEEGSFLDDEGSKVTFDISVLKRGILIQEIDQKLILLNGILMYKKIEEETD